MAFGPARVAQPPGLSRLHPSKRFVQSATFYMRIVYLLIALLLSASLFSKSWGQRIPANNVPYRSLTIPPAPNASSLGKFGAIPVNTFTGVPKVEVPLYEINCGGMHVPIALLYHSSLKVEEVPSWVGHGWALSAGGVVTQTIRGRIDQGAQGYWYQKAIVDSLNPRLLSFGHHGFTDQVFQGSLDTQPDIYYYNLPGMAGQLIFSDSTHAAPVTERGIDIQFARRTFYVTDRTGTRYVFGDSDANRDYTSASSDLDEPGRSSGGGSAYYLSLMISANQQDTIRFRYAAEDFQEELRGMETDFIPAGFDSPVLPKSTATTTKNSHQNKLQEIRWKGGCVQFTSTLARNDLPGTTALQQIEVRDAQGETIKVYTFSYEYFYSNNDLTDTHPVSGYWYAPESQRLKLVALQESNGSLHLPKYRFHYYEHLGMPPRNSCRQDHWGFANRNPLPTLLPAAFVVGNGIGVYPGGADRSPDFASALAGTLKEIIYPTGGQTKLVYEAHSIRPAPGATVTTLARTVHSLSLTDIEVQTPDTSARSSTQLKTKKLIFSISHFAGAELTCNETVSSRGGGGIVTMLATLGRCNNPPSCNDVAMLNAYPVSSTATGTRSVVQRRIMTLVPGTYVLNLSGDADNPSVVAQCHGSINVALTESITTPQNADVAVGGIRIKRLVDLSSTGADSLVQHYAYTAQQSTPTVSSGVLVSEPVYTSNYSYYYRDMRLAGGGGYIVALISALYTSISSAPKAGLGLTHGAHVGYQRVVVSRENAGLDNGSEVFYYSAPPDVGALNPYHPPQSREYLRGWLLRHEYYSNQGALLKRIRNTYRVDTRRAYQLSGLVLYKFRSDEAYLLYNDIYLYTYFRDESRWVYPSSTTTVQYVPGDTTQSSVQQQDFLYANPDHGQLTQSRLQISPGCRQVRYTRYAPDYPVQGTERGIQQLQSAHVWALPIEESEWRQGLQPGDSVLLSSTLHTYRPVSTGPVSLEDKLYSLSLAQPTAAFVHPVPTAGGWQLDPRYQERERYSHYDRYGNVGQILREHSQCQDYIWDNRGEHLLAKVQGAAGNQLAFTSFEPDAPGRFAYDPQEGSNHRVLGGRTGRWAYRLDGSGRVRCDSLAAGDYELLFWVQATQRPQLYTGASIASEQRVATAPGGWNQFRLRLRFATMGSVGLDASASAPMLLDEVRLHPAQAQMTSYTHAPLVGITSQTDPSGRTTTYEYDGLGRLLRTRDEQGRVLSQERYQYAHP